MAKITFLLGGVRSGKSSYAIELANKISDKVVYLATGVACDDEMKLKIELHKKTRPKSWKVIEEPLNIETALDRVDKSIKVIIFDCLTFWVSNLIRHYQTKGTTKTQLDTEITNRVCKAISIAKGVIPQVIIVSNEVGMGIVPDTELGRAFRDILGRANQIVAVSADEVFFLVAGLPVKIK